MSSASSKGSYQGAIARLQALQTIGKKGERWAENAAKALQVEAVEQLTSRSKSAATKLIEQRSKRPRKVKLSASIQVSTERSGTKTVAVCGVLAGQASMIARVQNRGATIRVTDKMRGWLHAHGIHLRASTQVIRIRGSRFWDRSCQSAIRSQKRQLHKLFS